MELDEAFYIQGSKLITVAVVAVKAGIHSSPIPGFFSIGLDINSIRSRFSRYVSQKSSSDDEFDGYIKSFGPLSYNRKVNESDKVNILNAVKRLISDIEVVYHLADVLKVDLKVSNLSNMLQSLARFGTIHPSFFQYSSNLFPQSTESDYVVNGVNYLPDHTTSDEVFTAESESEVEFMSSDSRDESEGMMATSVSKSIIVGDDTVLDFKDLRVFTVSLGVYDFTEINAFKVVDGTLSIIDNSTDIDLQSIFSSMLANGFISKDMMDRFETQVTCYALDKGEAVNGTFSRMKPGKNLIGDRILKPRMSTSKDEVLKKQDGQLYWDICLFYKEFLSQSYQDARRIAEKSLLSLIYRLDLFSVTPNDDLISLDPTLSDVNIQFCILKDDIDPDDLRMASLRVPFFNIFSTSRSYSDECRAFVSAIMIIVANFSEKKIVPGLPGTGIRRVWTLFPIREVSERSFIRVDFRSLAFTLSVLLNSLGS